MLLQSFLERSAQRLPGKTAIVHENERLTYAELDALANRTARALAHLGVRRGDRVVIAMENGSAAAAAIWGVLKADAVFVVVSSTIKADALAYIVADCAARALVADAPRSAVAAEAARACPCVSGMLVHADSPPEGLPPRVEVLTAEELVTRFDCTRPPSRNIDQDLAALVYTSGSTGRPKGVMEAHWNVVSVCNSIVEYLGNIEDDVLAAVLPFNSGYGLSQLLTAAQVGATLVIPWSSAFPFPVVALMRREGVTGLAGVPTVFAMFLRLESFTQATIPTMRYITNAGAAIPLPYVHRLRSAFPDAKLFLMYGQTECQRITYLPPEELDRRPLSVGRGMPNQEHWVADEHGQPVGPGVVGELVVRGSHVMRGYWNLPEESAARFRPGPVPGETMLYTGDLFRTDEDGFLYFVSRTDDIIKSRGQKVSPKEVEDVLYELPQVAEAAVVPADDETLGQAIHAYLVLAEGQGLSEREVLRHCASRLEDFKIPHRVFFRTSFPRGETGKLSKKDLRPDG